MTIVKKHVFNDVVLQLRELDGAYVIEFVHGAYVHVWYSEEGRSEDIRSSDWDRCIAYPMLCIFETLQPATMDYFFRYLDKLSDTRFLDVYGRIFFEMRYEEKEIEDYRELVMNYQNMVQTIGLKKGISIQKLIEIETRVNRLVEAARCLM